MSNYENETCEGCAKNKKPPHGWPKAGDFCIVKSDTLDPFLIRCDAFTPSLECRQVRALEALAGRVDFLIDHGLAYVPCSGEHYTDDSPSRGGGF